MPRQPLQALTHSCIGYRLYTVVPRLLGLIDNTTNWYIRFNRRRLKGENGLDDTLHALNALFEVLFTLCRGLAPFTPFLSDTIYLKLLSHIPKELQGDDPRSVHFLPYPEVREELFDAEVERRVSRMQRVIDLARVSRERRGISLKTPLRSLVVIHHNPQYLDDVKSLEGYIMEELNVRELLLSGDESSYDVQLSVTADWPVLGKKLRKDMARVKKALPDLTSEQVRVYLQNKEIFVDGIRLEEGDLVIRRTLRENPASKHFEMNSDSDLLTILDSEIYPELAEEGLAREVINRVQRLRKKAGLQATDDVRMEYRVLTDPDGIGLGQVFMSQTAAFEKTLRRGIDGLRDDADAGRIIAEEVQEVQEATFLLRLMNM